MTKKKEIKMLLKIAHAATMVAAVIVVLMDVIVWRS